MSQAFNMQKEEVNNGLDRRDFIMAGLALTAVSMLPRIVTAATAKQPQTIPLASLALLRCRPWGWDACR